MSSVYGTLWFYQISFVGFFVEIPVCTKTICIWTGFFGPTRRGYAAVADSSHNFVHRMHKVMRKNRFITKPLRPSTDGAAKLQRQVSSGSSRRCPVIQRILPLFARSPDRSTAYYHDALRHICQGSTGTSISPASPAYETGGGTIRTKTHSSFR